MDEDHARIPYSSPLGYGDDKDSLFVEGEPVVKGQLVMKRRKGH